MANKRKPKAQYLVFSKRFTNLCNQWKKKQKASGEPYSDAALASILHVAQVSSISRWRKGLAYPSLGAMEAIGEFFNIDPDSYFSPFYDWERGADKEFNDVKTFELHQFCEENGISEDLVRLITSNPHLERCFPLANSIHIDMNTDTVEHKSLFQISDECNNTYYLDKSDLIFIGIVQEKIVEQIQAMFYLQQAKYDEALINDYLQVCSIILKVSTDTLVKDCKIGKSFNDQKDVGKQLENICKAATKLKADGNLASRLPDSVFSHNTYNLDNYQDRDLFLGQLVSVAIKESPELFEQYLQTKAIEEKQLIQTITTKARQQYCINTRGIIDNG